MSVGVEVEPAVDLRADPSRWLANHAQPCTGFRSAAVASGIGIGIGREAGITATSAIIARWIDVSDDDHVYSARLRSDHLGNGSLRPL